MKKYAGLLLIFLTVPMVSGQLLGSAYTPDCYRSCSPDGHYIQETCNGQPPRTIHTCGDATMCKTTIAFEIGCFACDRRCKDASTIQQGCYWSGQSPRDVESCTGGKYCRDHPPGIMGSYWGDPLEASCTFCEPTSGCSLDQRYVETRPCQTDTEVRREPCAPGKQCTQPWGYLPTSPACYDCPLECSSDRTKLIRKCSDGSTVEARSCTRGTFCGTTIPCTWWCWGAQPPQTDCFSCPTDPAMSQWTYLQYQAGELTRCPTLTGRFVTSDDHHEKFRIKVGNVPISAAVEEEPSFYGDHLVSFEDSQNRRLLEFTAQFGQGDVDLSEVILSASDSDIAVEGLETVDNIKDIAFYSYSGNELGFFICPGATAVSELKPDCPGAINFRRADFLHQDQVTRGDIVVQKVANGYRISGPGLVGRSS